MIGESLFCVGAGVGIVVLDSLWSQGPWDSGFGKDGSILNPGLIVDDGGVGRRGGDIFGCHRLDDLLLTSRRELGVHLDPEKPVG